MTHIHSSFSPSLSSARRLNATKNSAITGNINRPAFSGYDTTSRQMLDPPQKKFLT